MFEGSYHVDVWYGVELKYIVSNLLTVFPRSGQPGRRIIAPNFLFE